MARVQTLASTIKLYLYDCPLCYEDMEQLPTDDMYSLRYCGNNYGSFEAYMFAYDADKREYYLKEAEEREIDCETCHANGNLYDSGE